jgi:hypothetical protein
MTTFTLGINTCFAVKRWPEPEVWARLVADELGLGLVQHSLDFVDLDATPAEVAAQAAAVRSACDAHSLTLHSTFTGLAAYSSNLLLHPEACARRRARSWYGRAIDFTAMIGAGSTGGHIGAFSATDFVDPARRSCLRRELADHLTVLAAHARQRGLEALMVENLAVDREPATMADIRALLRPGDADHVPVTLCLDVGHQCAPGMTGADLDPYAWLRELGASATVVQLQQSDAHGDHHWAFTPQHNAAGRIDAARVLDALEGSGADHVALVLEVIPPFEQGDEEVLGDLVASCDHWRRHLR